MSPQCYIMFSVEPEKMPITDWNIHNDCARNYKIKIDADVDFKICILADVGGFNNNRK